MTRVGAGTGPSIGLLCFWAMSSRIRKPLSLAIGGAIFLAGAIWARRSLGIELEPQSIRTFVQGLGAVGPIAMITLITFRSLLGIPSQLILIAAGLCFGVTAGTLYGGIGLTLSAMGTFGIARYAGRESVETHVPPRIKRILERAGDRIGAVIVGIATGYPIGFITAYHAVAGITSMPFVMFALAVAAGGLVRAATFTYFGDVLIEGGSGAIIQATVILTALFTLPLLIPSVRRWVKQAVLAQD